MATAAAYPLTAAYFHWLAALPMLGCVGSVLKAQEAPKEEKGTWMHRHKSLGLLTGMIVFPRFAYRIFNASKFRLESLRGSGSVETSLGNAAHYALYGFMGIMPISGIAMGYYGGKGLPFFSTSFAGVVHTDETKKANLAIAKQSFQIHKQIGTYGKFLIPLHVAGGLQHWARGQAIFARINPFRKPRF
mmetsp:Transcript_18539/g.33579  ORF Transcript_18539/g.33579 Transcript_18539/m.33579 type:complete len:189 (-) Transcript_18539:202-768(-)